MSKTIENGAYLKLALGVAPTPNWATITTESGVQIGAITVAPAGGIASEIVKRWNAHEKLMECARALVRVVSTAEPLIESHDMHRLVGDLAELGIEEEADDGD